MADASINFKNKAEIEARLNLLSTQVDEAVQRTAQEFILTGRSEIQKNMYPGHAYRTGNLRSSIQAEVVESSKCQATIKIWSEVTYGPAVEFGHGGKYSFFRPGIQVTIKKANDYFNEQLSGVMK